MALLLRRRGIHRVRPLEGGLDGWRGRGLPLAEPPLAEPPLAEPTADEPTADEPTAAGAAPRPLGLPPS